MKTKWFKQLFGAPTLSVAPATFRGKLWNAVQYWERCRVIYNVVLVAVVVAWLVSTWPHFRPAFTLQSLPLLLVLAAMANACYCAAYVADLIAQYSPFGSAWRHGRWGLWLAGTLFGILLACYWIADEIYPSV